MRVSEYEMQFIKPVFQNDTIQIVAEKMKQDGDAILLEVIGRRENERVVKGNLFLVR